MSQAKTAGVVLFHHSALSESNKPSLRQQHASNPTSWVEWSQGKHPEAECHKSTHHFPPEDLEPLIGLHARLSTQVEGPLRKHQADDTLALVSIAASIQYDNLQLQLFRFFGRSDTVSSVLCPFERKHKGFFNLQLVQLAKPLPLTVMNLETLFNVNQEV